MVEIIKREPHHSVVKEAICRNCGVTLSYVPADVQKRTYKDYTGSSDTDYVINCPNCDHTIIVR